MTKPSRFNDYWVPTVLKTEVLAWGTWVYQDAVPYKANLICWKWDYVAADIEEIEANVQGYNIDYLDYSIGQDGNVFFWTFEGQTGKHESPTFPTYEEARKHITTYAGTSTIRWSAEDKLSLTLMDRLKVCALRLVGR